MTRRATLFTSFTALLVVFGVLFVRFYAGWRYSEAEKWRRVYDGAVKLVRDNYVTPVDTEKVTCDALRGVCRSLDPFSDFFDARAYEQFNNEMKGEYSGVGIYIKQEDDGTVRVIAPIFGGPAQRAGIMPGDIVIAVDGEKTEGLGVEEVSMRIKGLPGTEVKVTFFRPAEGFSMVRLGTTSTCSSRKTAKIGLATCGRSTSGGRVGVAEGGS